jgi:hypothetical protein
MLLQLVLALLAGAPQADAHERVTITLAMQSHVRGTEVELGEIADISGGSPELLEALRGLELGYAPAPGYSRLFRTDQVRKAIARKLPGAAGLTVAFAGQSAIRVYPEVEEIGGDEILAAVRARLFAEFGGAEIAFEPRDAMPSIAVPAGTETHTIAVRVTRAPETSGPFTVPVDILIDGVRYRTVWTSWEVSVWETRPVLARRVRAGELLSPSLFVRERVKVTTGRGAALDAGVLNGSVALHDLLAGKPVTTLDVQRPQVLAVGEAVFLRVRLRSAGEKGEY